jgi:hypothetical protein
LGLPGEDNQSIEETSCFYHELLNQFPGRVEVNLRPYDPYGINPEEDFFTPASFVLDNISSCHIHKSDYFNSEIHKSYYGNMWTRLRISQYDILKYYIDIMDKVPYSIALRHLDIEKFGTSTTWKEVLLNVPHIRSYARAYQDYRNSLVTDPCPEQSKILHCYPMRTLDNFIYTENEDIILKLFINKVAVLDSTSSFIFRLCSGELTVLEIVDRVIEKWDIQFQDITKVSKEVTDYVVSLERAFLLILIKPCELS